MRGPHTFVIARCPIFAGSRTVLVLGLGLGDHNLLGSLALEGHKVHRSLIGVLKCTAVRFRFPE